MDSFLDLGSWDENGDEEPHTKWAHFQHDLKGLVPHKKNMLPAHAFNLSSLDPSMFKKGFSEDSNRHLVCLKGMWLPLEATQMASSWSRNMSIGKTGDVSTRLWYCSSSIKYSIDSYMKFLDHERKYTNYKPPLLQLLLLQALSTMWKSCFFLHMVASYFLRNELTQVPLGDPHCIHRYLHHDLRSVNLLGSSNGWIEMERTGGHNDKNKTHWKRRICKQLLSSQTPLQNTAYMGVSKNTGTLKWMVYNGTPY